MNARLHTLSVGQPREILDSEPFFTAFHKTPATSPVFLSLENLAGDQQADLTVHGGTDKAVCVYSVDHYPAWRKETGIAECGPGWFGENFSIAGQRESTVAIGDTFRIGAALVQVSQPRVPCWKLGRRWSRPDMPKLVVHSGRTGWYLRVIEEGMVKAGQELTLVERLFPQMTIERVNDVAYRKGGRTEELIETARRLAECPALAEGWREDFRLQIEEKA
jgi:MOSC domain-containing protein YiiM